LPPLQSLLVPHCEQLPPQSMSLSVPFLTESVQLGAWHFLVLALHTPLWQS
jgi:hypothetical protein